MAARPRTIALDVDRLRADTPGSRVVTHLNNAGAALPPAVVVDTVVAHLRREAEIGGYEAHAEAAERIDAVYRSLGRLVGAPAPSIAVVESATSAWDRAFLALRHAGALPSGSRVLLAESEYASNVLPVLQLAARGQVEPVFVPDGPDGTLDVEALRSLLDERVALVAVTHAPSQNGLLNDVAGIGRVLRETGHPGVVPRRCLPVRRAGRRRRRRDRLRLPVGYRTQVAARASRDRLPVRRRQGPDPGAVPAGPALGDVDRGRATRSRTVPCGSSGGRSRMPACWASGRPRTTR